MKFKLYFLCLLAFPLFFLSCEKKTVSSPFSTDSLVSQEFTIALDRDTVLTTAKGALIRIPKGAIQSKNKTQVKLLLKEAYDLESMILGGLSTKSDSGMLSSAGMFFLSCKDSSDYTFAKPIEFSIPTVSVNPEMQLYQGEVKPDGSIVWKNEKPIKRDSSDLDMAKGKELFEGNCTSCHDLGSVKVGPDLAYIGENRDKKWLYRFTRNSHLVIRDENDPWANQLYCEYNNTEMTSFPTFTDAELAALYAYIDQYSYQNKLPQPRNSKACLDSCKKFNERMVKLYNKRSKLLAKKNNLTSRVDRNTFNRISPVSPSSSSTVNSTVTNAPQSEKGEHLNYAPKYYKVEVQAFGWYNIDQMMKKFPDVKPAFLEVDFGEESIENSVNYLVIPDYNVVAEGLKMKDGKIGFDQNDGSIPLPVGRKALIISTKEDKDGVWFAIHSFTISEKNKISIRLEKISNGDANKKIKALQLKDFSYQIKESIYRKENLKNEKKEAELSEKLEEIESAIKEADALRPKGCHCSCGHAYEGDLQ